jgi:hypothetical protein
MFSKKYSVEQIKSLPPEFFLLVINRAKKYLKNNEVMQRICKEHKQSVEIIDLIPTMFADLDVSAKTDHGIVLLNYKLLCDGDFFKDYMYLIHEYSHYFQQCWRDKPTYGSEKNYLDNEFEQEGFQNQVEFMSSEFGEEQAEKYVDHLLKHHEIHDKREKKLKKDELMMKV